MNLCNICKKELIEFKDDMGISLRHKSYIDFIQCGNNE